MQNLFGIHQTKIEYGKNTCYKGIYGVHLSRDENTRPCQTTTISYQRIPRLVQRAVLGVRINAPIKLIFKKLSQASHCTPSGDKTLPRMAHTHAKKMK